MAPLTAVGLVKRTSQFLDRRDHRTNPVTTEVASAPKGMSPLAIAGIVILVLVVLISAGLLCWWCVIKMRQRRQTASQTQAQAVDGWKMDMLSLSSSRGHDGKERGKGKREGQAKAKGKVFGLSRQEGHYAAGRDSFLPNNSKVLGGIYTLRRSRVPSFHSTVSPVSPLPALTSSIPPTPRLPSVSSESDSIAAEKQAAQAAAKTEKNDQAQTQTQTQLQFHQSRRVSIHITRSHNPFPRLHALNYHPTTQFGQYTPPVPKPAYFAEPQ